MILVVYAVQWMSENRTFGLAIRTFLCSVIEHSDFGRSGRSVRSIVRISDVSKRPKTELSVFVVFRSRAVAKQFGFRKPNTFDRLSDVRFITIDRLVH